MTIIKLRGILTAIVSLSIGAAVQAAPIVNDNVRPVTVNAAYSGEKSLQSVLDQLFGTGAVDASTDQSTAGIWGSATGAPATTIPTLIIEQTSGASSQKFGIWFGTDTGNLLMVDLFYGGAVGDPSGRSAAGLYLDAGYLQIDRSGPQANCGTQINCTTIIDSRIDPYSFGFYFTSGSTTAYSIDSLAGLNSPTRFLAYQHGATTNWAFAFEDGSDFDYQDMVVKVESIKVPLPGTVALLGIGLVGAGLLRRSRK